MNRVKLALEAWCIAHQQQTEAELRVVSWRLQSPEPVPKHLLDEVAALVDRTNHLFEVAAVAMAAPDSSWAAPL
jgi:hypothetical protein